MAELVHDQVLVCGLVPYRDDDLVVRLFTRNFGRVGAFARAARKSKKRFAGLVAPALGTAALKQRSGDLLELVELDVDARLFSLASDLRAYAFAAYVLELIERFVPEGAPQPELFSLVEETVVFLAQHGARAAVLRSFELHLLHILGVLPDLSAVVDEPGAPCEAYDPVSGHLLAHGSAAAVPFSEETRLLAVQLLHRSPGNSAFLPIAEGGLRAVAPVFGRWLRGQGGAPMKALAFLRSLDEQGRQCVVADLDPSR